MRTLIIDNFDSFTYNLVHLLRQLGEADFEVRRNNAIGIEEATTFSRILLSPGPGIPSEAGVMPSLVRALAPTHSILGVCLGHQCIGEVFGAKLKNLVRPVHGKGTEIRVHASSDPLFSGIPSPFTVGRYHSWVIDPVTVPPPLEVLATDSDGEIMAVRHRAFRVWGVQFHPDSILTEHGAQLLQNWLQEGAC